MTAKQEYLTMAEKYTITSSILLSMKNVRMWTTNDIAAVHIYLIDCFAVTSKINVIQQLIPKSLISLKSFQNTFNEKIAEEDLIKINKLKQTQGFELLQQHVVYKLLDV
jgi:hypothetical protein